MAGLSSSTVQRGSGPLRQQASSDEMAEILRAWDDEDDEMVEFIENSKADGQNLSRNANGLSAVSGVGANRSRLATYSPSSVRSAKTICLFISFFGLGASVAILGPTLLELACHTNTKLEHMSYVFTSRSIGYLIGSMIGGWLFDKYNGHVVLSVSCVWGTLMMLVLPYVTSVYGLVIVTALLGLGIGSLDTGGNVLLLNTWGKKSRPYLQALHFMFALGAFVAPLIVQPFLHDSCPPSNCTLSSLNNDTNSTMNGTVNGTRCTIGTSNNTSGNTMPVTWAYWISSIPLAATGIGFLIFVFIKACSLRDTETQKEEAPKTKQGSLIYRIIILSLFSVFLLLYVGLEVAYGGYIFTFGRTTRKAMSEDSAAFLTSAFWGSFALARLASVPISRYLQPSKMLWMDMAGCLLGSILLLSQLKDGDCRASDMTKLWVGTVLLGISMASVFPSTINWAEYFVTVSGRTASILLVAASCGEMLIPLAVGNTIGDTIGPCSLMACAFAISVLVLVTFLCILASGRYFKRNSTFAGMLYQRSQRQEKERGARQTDEVLDLLEQNNELFNNGDQEMTI